MVRSGEENQGHFIEIQALDLGSIPIARSINPDGSVDLTRLSSLNSIKTRPVLDGGWTVVGRYWTQLDGQFSLEPLLLEQTVNELSAGGMAQTLDCLAEGCGFDPHRRYQSSHSLQRTCKFREAAKGSNKSEERRRVGHETHGTDGEPTTYPTPWRFIRS